MECCKADTPEIVRLGEMFARTLCAIDTTCRVWIIALKDEVIPGSDE